MKRFAMSLAASAIAAFAMPAFGGLVNTVNSSGTDTFVTDGTVNAAEYAGSVSGGGSGFGGPVGSGTVRIGANAAGVGLGFNFGNFGGNSVRVYFNTVGGGFNNLSAAGGFNDFADFGRERISRVDAGGLTLPFDADYGLIISEAFGGFQANFQLIQGGNGSLGAPNTGNVYTDPDSDDNGSTNADIESFLTYGNLGLTPGQSAVIDFVVVYANNNDNTSAFLSNESFPFQGGAGNYGSDPAVFTEYHRLVISVPEPASMGMLGLGAIGLLAKRRRNA